MSDLKMKDCPSGGADRWSYLLLLLHTLIFIGTIIGNSLVIIAVLRYRRLRTPTNYFVTSLAIADLIVGTSIPYYVSFYFDVPYVCSKYPCLIRVSWSMFGALWSLLLMIGVTVDRYLAVLHPLHYPSWIKPRLVLGYSVGTGIYMGIIMILPIVSDVFNTIDDKVEECDIYFMYNVTYTLAAVLFHIALALVINTVLYVKIFMEAWKQKKQEEALNIPRLRKDYTTSKMMVIIFGLSLIALLPYFACVCARFLTSTQTLAISEIKKLTTVLFFAKSVTNPFVYGWKNKGFRQAFKSIIRCGRKKRNNLEREFGPATITR